VFFLNDFKLKIHLENHLKIHLGKNPLAIPPLHECESGKNKKNTCKNHFPKNTSQNPPPHELGFRVKLKPGLDIF
jgi:hypothetical protein